MFHGIIHETYARLVSCSLQCGICLKQRCTSVTRTSCQRRATHLAQPRQPRRGHADAVTQQRVDKLSRSPDATPSSPQFTLPALPSRDLAATLEAQRASNRASLIRKRKQRAPGHRLIEWTYRSQNKEQDSTSSRVSHQERSVDAVQTSIGAERSSGASGVMPEVQSLKITHVLQDVAQPSRQTQGDLWVHRPNFEGRTGQNRPSQPYKTAQNSRIVNRGDR